MKLTRRETDILRLLIQGHCLSSAAATLGIEYQVVKNHLCDARARNGTNTHELIAKLAVSEATGSGEMRKIYEPLSPVEQSILQKLSCARFPPGTASKRFVRDMSGAKDRKISDAGRRFLAFVAHRFRRQCSYSDQEWAWIRRQNFLAFQDASASRLPEPLGRLLHKLPTAAVQP